MQINKAVNPSLSMDKLTSVSIFLYVMSLYLLTYREGLNMISNALALIVVASIWINIIVSRKNIIFNKLILFQTLFIVSCVISACFAVNQRTVISKVRTLFLILIVMFSLVNYIDTYEKVMVIVKSFIYAGLFTSIFIILNSDFSMVTRYGRDLGNQNAVGMNIAISSIFCFYMIISKKKYLFATFFLVMIPSVLLTGSRKSLLFIIINIIIISYLKNRKGLSKHLKFIVVSTCVLLISYYLVFNIPLFYQIIGVRIENTFAFLSGESTNEASINVRYGMTKVGLGFFLKRPITGYGIDNYRFLYSGTYSHNNFIELMVGVGAFGLLAYYMTHVVLVRDLLKTSKNRTLEIISFTFLAIIISYIILSPSIVYYDNKHFSILLALASTICFCTNKNKCEDNRD